MENNNLDKSKYKSIAEDAWSILFGLALLIYLCIGIFAHIWHPSWVVFVIAVGVGTIISIICRDKYSRSPKMDNNVDSFDKQFERTFIYNKCVKVSGILFAVTVITYVVVNSFVGMWHPLWLMFILMSVVEEISAIIFKIRFKDFRTEAEEETKVDVDVANEPGDTETNEEKENDEKDDEED